MVSTAGFNQSPADLTVVLPVTSKDKRVSWHVRLEPPEGGLNMTSFVKCENVRCISKQRLVQRWGVVSAATMEQVNDRLRILLEL